MGDGADPTAGFPSHPTRPLGSGQLLGARSRGDARVDPDTTYARMAAVLEGWHFDRARYRVPGATYRVTDLTHWLALDVASQTLTSAGFPGGVGLDRDRVGVVIGNTLGGEFTRASSMRLRWPYARKTLTEAMVAEGLDVAVGDRLLASFERSYKAPFAEPTDESLSGSLANVIAGRILQPFRAARRRLHR